MSSRLHLYQAGYAAVAKFIASDAELSICRRFDRSTARILLYLQSEIQYNQNLLDAIDENDAESGESAASSWELENEPIKPIDPKRKEIMMCMRALMKEYYELLTLQSQVLQLRPPAKRILKVFDKWLSHKKPLVGVGKEVFQDTMDMVALGPAQGGDPFSGFLRNHLSCVFKVRGPKVQREWEEIYYFSDLWVAKAATVISITTSLSMAAITSLYYVNQPGARLVMIAGYIFVFAVCVTLLSTAQRAEVFAATAAFAAVLVVFVSGNLANPRQH
ncbi:MAG: hypothetical protein M1840_007179 [Geoglossum simile]|nr:MAG: hypothetical protein M1840_007179 [Geoglossum simile]